MTDSRSYGLVFGKVMQKHPKADAVLVNSILITAWDEIRSVVLSREDALLIIEACRGWNTGQTSASLAFTGKCTDEDDVLDAKRETLRQAWLTLRGGRS